MLGEFHSQEALYSTTFLIRGAEAFAVPEHSWAGRLNKNPLLVPKLRFLASTARWARRLTT